MAAADHHRHDEIDKLNGTNYQSWKYNIKLVLMARGLFSIVDGSEKAPEIKEEDATKADSIKTKKEWRLRSDKAYTTIALSVEKSLQVHISSTTDAHEAWETLRKQFEVVSVSQVVRLFRRFYAAEMKEEDDLQTFITKMTSLAQDLREMNEDISSKKFATVILGSLPQSYQNFVTSFNTKSIDDLCWDNVRGLLHEEYLKRKEIAEKTKNNIYQQPQSNSESALFTTGVGGSGRGLFRGAGVFRGSGSFRGGVGVFRGGAAGFRGGTGNSSFRDVGGGNSNRGRGNSSNRGGHGGSQRYTPYRNTNNSFQGSCYSCGRHGHKASNCSEQQDNNHDQGLFVADNTTIQTADNNEFFHEEDLALSTQFYADSGEEHQTAKNNDFFHEEDLALSTEFYADSEEHQLQNMDHEEDVALINTVFSHKTSSDNVERQDHWYIDSAATRHMTYDKSILMDFRLYSEEEKLSSKIKLGNDYVIPAIGEGKVRLATSNNKNGQHLALERVAYVPQLRKNLLSVATMTENGAEVRFDNKKCVVVKNNKHFDIGHKNGKLYCVGLPQNSMETACFSSSASANHASKGMWHCRFGHLNGNDVDNLVKCHLVKGMNFVAESEQQKSVLCEGCILGKMMILGK